MELECGQIERWGEVGMLLRDGSDLNRQSAQLTSTDASLMLALCSGCPSIEPRGKLVDFQTGLVVCRALLSAEDLLKPRSVPRNMAHNGYRAMGGAALVRSSIEDHRD